MHTTLVSVSAVRFSTHSTHLSSNSHTTRAGNQVDGISDLSDTQNQSRPTASRKERVYKKEKCVSINNRIQIECSHSSGEISLMNDKQETV